MNIPQGSPILRFYTLGGHKIPPLLDRFLRVKAGINSKKSWMELRSLEAKKYGEAFNAARSSFSAIMTFLYHHNLVHIKTNNISYFGTPLNHEPCILIENELGLLNKKEKLVFLVARRSVISSQEFRWILSGYLKAEKEALYLAEMIAKGEREEINELFHFPEILLTFEGVKEKNMKELIEKVESNFELKEEVVEGDEIKDDFDESVLMTPRVSFKQKAEDSLGFVFEIYN